MSPGPRCGASVDPADDGGRPAGHPGGGGLNGLWVYQTDDNTTQHGLWYYDAPAPCPGPAWRRMADGRGWNFGEHRDQRRGQLYIGTADATDLVFRTNNVERMRVAATGEVGSNPAQPEALHVTGRVYAFDDPVNMNGSIGKPERDHPHNPREHSITKGNVNNARQAISAWRTPNSGGERLYEGFQLDLGPGSATAVHTTTPPTRATPFVTANSSGRVQYIFRAAELTALACPGNIDRDAIYVLDDDNTSAP